jgi:hypothetical protein
MSSFQLQFSECNDSVSPVLPSKESQYDLAIFLSVIQKLDIEFLPVTRNALEAFGHGGSADIHQAVVNIDTAFAFKHASRLFDERGEVDAYRALVSEVLVLGNPAVRDHPNVIDLEGICWEFDAKDLHLRPVLVFEKAQHGDLQRFLSTTEWNDSSFEMRLNLCVDIACAIMALHQCGMIFRS